MVRRWRLIVIVRECQFFDQLLKKKISRIKIVSDHRGHY